MTCKNCCHFKDCQKGYFENTDYYFGEGDPDTAQNVEDYCRLFIDSGLIIKLPCKMGTPLYIVFRKCAWHYRRDEKYWLVRKTRLSPNNMESVIAGFGKNYFLTREEAEAAMEKMKQESRER